MEIPQALRYAENHEWARRDDDGTVAVGITDYAQDALGDIVYVDLPEVGTVVDEGEAFGEVESTKSVSEVYAPVTGTIVAVNEALDTTPELVNQDPYGDGWFVRIDAAGELDHLMDAVGYGEHTAQ